MTEQELDVIESTVFDAKIQFEDMIELAKNGFPHCYKKGFPQRKLKEAEKCLVIIQRERKNLK